MNKPARKRSTRKPSGPRGGSSTIIHNPDNPAASIHADDVSVKGSVSLPACGTRIGTVGGQALVGAASRCSEVVVQADLDNTERLFIGNAAAQTIELDAGDSIPIPVSDANLIFVRSAGGTAVANYLTRS